MIRAMRMRTLNPYALWWLYNGRWYIPVDSITIFIMVPVDFSVLIRSDSSLNLSFVFYLMLLLHRMLRVSSIAQWSNLSFAISNQIYVIIMLPVSFPPNLFHSPQTCLLSADILRHPIQVRNERRGTYAPQRGFILKLNNAYPWPVHGIRTG